MFNAGVLALSEKLVNEPLPIATIQDAVIEFLYDRDDVVVFGAQAVNVYTSELRMSQDVDVLSTRAAQLAEELRAFLNQRFHIAVRVRQVAEGKGLRLYQVRKTGNRHLVDIRPVELLPPHRRVGRVLVATPEELVAQKVIAVHQRSGQPKAFTDRRDLAMLLLAFPELKNENSTVADRLRAANASDEVMRLWREIVAQEIRAADEDSEFE
ncbi:MAG: nucleotidyl transferase AbiEii/AbiGii toxin family protein [Chloroflexi bacterium]|nr:nucleotidyl transferase AbiEii/AbiGii toxin family protein [Chloroflexota bacterium]